MLGPGQLILVTDTLGRVELFDVVVPVVDGDDVVAEPPPPVSDVMADIYVNDRPGLRRSRFKRTTMVGSNGFGCPDRSIGSNSLLK